MKYYYVLLTKIVWDIPGNHWMVGFDDDYPDSFETLRIEADNVSKAIEQSRARAEKEHMVKIRDCEIRAREV